MKEEIKDIAKEIDEWIENNPLSQALLERSNLKKGELKALMLYFRREDISFSDISPELGINRSGAWKRWKKGYNKIIESFFTLELAVYGGILDPEATQLLMEDLRDYLKLAHEKGNIEKIRSRLEKRLVELEKRKK
ncbi:MAG: hypothetical protein ACLFUR_00015 [Candidatus Hadarchaeia archaeon]